jgi:hypothetical protein
MIAAPGSLRSTPLVRVVFVATLLQVLHRGWTVLMISLDKIGDDLEHGEITPVFRYLPIWNAVWITWDRSEVISLDCVLLLMDTVNVSSRDRTIAYRMYRTSVHYTLPL